MEKTHAGMMGIEESEDEVHDSDAVGDEGELGVVMNTLRCSPPRVSKTRANGFIHSQLVSSRVPTAEVFEDDDARVIAEWESRRKEEEFQDYSNRIENPPSPIVAAYTRVNARDADSLFASPTLPSQTQSVCSALEKAAESTPPMLKSVQNAMARAESLAKAAKTKNSSTKKKERTSIAGTIVKMIERIDSSSNSTMMTNMNMMMMRTGFDPIWSSLCRLGFFSGTSLHRRRLVPIFYGNLRPAGAQTVWLLHFMLQLTILSYST